MKRPLPFRAAFVGWVLAFQLCLLIAGRAAVDTRDAVLAQLRRSEERYDSVAKWEQRRAAIREEFLKGARLWPLPDKTALNASVRERRDYDGYSVENVALETFPGFFCTGNLYRPRGRAAARGPAVLCPHGHFKPLGRFRAEHQIRCAQFARMGATVFSYGMVGWNDSRQTTHDDPLVLALQTWNSIRALDFLASLPEVDPTRIGATGASGGGSQSLFLGTVDERLAVSAPVVIVYPWTAPQGCECEGGLPVMQAADTNAIELAAAFAPRPQLLISVGQDRTRDFPEVGFPFIARAYELHGRRAAVENVHLHDEGHDYGPSKRAAATRFFATHLGMIHLPEETDRIAIETPAQLEVFNQDHPLPSHALQGSAAIRRAFDALPRPKNNAGPRNARTVHHTP